MSSIANKGVPIRLVDPISTSLPFQHPTHLERMLQNHSRCRNGRGCGKHPPDTDGPRSDGDGSLSEQGSIAQYQERPKKSSALGTQGRLQNEGDSLEGGEADVTNRAKASYTSTDEEYGPEACFAEEEQGGHKPITRSLKRKRKSGKNSKEAAMAKSRKRVRDWLQQRVHVGDDMRRQAL